MNSKNSQSLWAGGFIYHPFKKKVLLHLRDYNTEHNPGKYAFFGGTAEGIETARQCCVREWEEEFGIRVSTKELSPLTEYTLSNGVTRSSFYLTLPLDMSQVEIMEGTGARWIGLDKLTDFPLSKNCYQDLLFFQELLTHKHPVQAL